MSGRANLETFFTPKSIAVIGASNDPRRVGYAIFKNLLDGKQKVFAVNDAEKEVLGRISYASITDVPDKVDLALLAIRARFVPEALSQCARVGIGNVIVVSAGFKEEGEEGVALEKRLAVIAQKNNLQVLGPNCLGVINLHSGLNASFAAGIPRAGGISFLSQSGAMGTAMLDWACMEGVGISKFVSLGNEAVTNELPFLEYFAQDKNTSALLCYFENIFDGPQFLELARKVAAKKPLVVLRAGRSARGASAVSSHTGSLAPNDAVFSAAIRQAGGIVVASLRELLSLAKLFQLGVYRPLQRLAILTNGGGPSVVAADQVELSHSLSLATLSDTTKESLKKTLPPMAAVGNPVDVIGDALSDRFASALKTLSADRGVEGIIAIVTPQLMTEMEKTAVVFMESHKKKPVLPVFMGGELADVGRATLQRKGFANFDFPSDVITALDQLATGNKKPEQRSADPKKDVKPQVLRLLPFLQTQKLLSEYKLPSCGVLVKNSRELASAWEDIKGPAVLKVVSPDIIHKSEARVVAVGVKTLAEAMDARERVLENAKKFAPHGRIEGVILQPQVPGHEVIVGMKRDKTFGPAVLVGLGGIFTEIMRDTALRVAPIRAQEAQAMIGETRAYAILSGARGGKKADIPALAHIISKLSYLAVEHPEIKEIDLNPVIVSEKGAIIADARFLQ